MSALSATGTASVASFVVVDVAVASVLPAAEADARSLAVVVVVVVVVLAVAVPERSLGIVVDMVVASCFGSSLMLSSHALVDALS